MHPPRDVPRLGRDASGRRCPRTPALSVTSSSTGVPKTGSGNSPEAASGWNSSPNSAREEVVDDREHLGPRAVVARQRQQRRRLARAARGRRARRRGGSRRSTGTRRRRRTRSVSRARSSRSISSHWSRFVSWNSSTMIERKRSCSRSRSASSLAEQVARAELQVLEVERRLAVLGRRVRVREAEQELLQQLAVAQRELVERRLLDRLARLLVASPPARRGRAARSGRAAAPAAAAPARARAPAPRRRALRRSRRASSARQRAASASSVEPLVEAGPLAELEHELAAGRAQRLVDGRQHPPQAGGAVGREQPQPLGIVARRRTRSAPPRTPRRGRPGPGSRRASRKRGSSPAANGCAFSSRRQKPWMVEIQAPSSERARSCRPSSRRRARIRAAQLPGGALGVRDHEHRLDVEPALADRLDEALDEHGRLAGPGAGRDEDLARAPRSRPPARAFGVAVMRALHPAHRARGRTTPGSRPSPSGRGGRRRPGSAAPARARGRARPRPAPRTRPRRGSRCLTKPGQRVVLRLGAEQAARPPLAGERPVEAAERLDPDEVAQHEHVERDLQPQLLLDLRRRVRRCGPTCSPGRSRARCTGRRRSGRSSRRA